MINDIPQTIAELKRWMAARCYNDFHYNLDGKMVNEGYGIRQVENNWVWFFSERGSFQPEEQFKAEVEIVAHALADISRNGSAQRHMVGFTASKIVAERLVGAIRARGITMFQDRIGYGGPDDPRFRVFVMGCDINEVRDLIVDER